MTTGRELSALIGRRVRAYRTRRGLTQFELAQRSGVSLTQIAALEQQVPSNVRADTVCRLAEALGVSHLDLQREGRRRRGRPG
jgi:transcriptional regulator with XRE-family HTH domain